nr:6,7-dimethyl-8-ribityllumazine synthase [Bacteroides sp.]
MSQHNPTTEVPRLDNLRVAIVTTEWNSFITSELAESARKRLIELGCEPDDAVIYTVPGAVELTFAASQIIEASLFDAVIVCGCVIRGGTPHFDYVCQSVTQGVTSLNADCDIPVIFGVLTVDNEEQARERLNKGPEYADTAVKMVAFKRMLEDA